MHGIGASCLRWLHRKSARAVVYACEGVRPWRTLVIELLTSYCLHLGVVSLAAFDRGFCLSELVPLVRPRGGHSALNPDLAFESASTFIIVARPRGVALSSGMITRG